MSNIQYIDILDKITAPEFWHWMGITRYHYTGHTHYNSPFESDDSCGTCDGAKCDICKKITEDPCLECSVPCDKLEQICIEKGCPADIVKDLVYDDFYRPAKSGWDIHWPTEQEFKEKFPDEYKIALEKAKAEK